MSAPDFSRPEGLIRIAVSSLAAGYACRATLTWISRPSPETWAMQQHVSTAQTLVVLALAALAVVLAGGLPVFLLILLACYVNVRVFQAWQYHGPQMVTRLQLFWVARAGEAASLAIFWLLAYATPLLS